MSAIELIEQIKSLKERGIYITNKFDESNKLKKLLIKKLYSIHKVIIKKQFNEGDTELSEGVYIHVNKKFKEIPSTSAMILIDKILELEKECNDISLELSIKSPSYKSLVKELQQKYSIRYKHDGNHIYLNEVLS